MLFGSFAIVVCGLITTLTKRSLLGILVGIQMAFLGIQLGFLAVQAGTSRNEIVSFVFFLSGASFLVVLVGLAIGYRVFSVRRTLDVDL